MKIAFLTEMGFHGKIPDTHSNMRTEFSWMCALNADHYHVRDWKSVSGYDYVMIILPKGGVYLNSEGKTLVNDKNVFSDVFASPIITDLKKENRKVCSVQEGPAWYSNDLALDDQFNFYNRLSECDILFTHNHYDTLWYRGLFPDKQVEVMPTLMIETLLNSTNPTPFYLKKHNVILGGNFSRWYGGFQSYIIAEEYIGHQKFVQTSHSSRIGEESIPDLTVLPRVYWHEWMMLLKDFRYAVHMMPTVAAGTFSLNCAYWGIPCIGNINVDTQRICFPSLSFHSENVYNARLAAKRLYEDCSYYDEISEDSKKYYRLNFSKTVYLEKMNRILV